MAIPNSKQLGAVWCWTASLAVSVVIGCGSSPPPPPPSTPPATTMAPAAPMSAPPNMAAAAPASAPMGGHTQAAPAAGTPSMPANMMAGNQASGHNQAGTPSAIPANMAGYNQGAGQTPNSGHNQTGSPPAGGYDAAAAAAMMKGAHGGAAGNAQANAGAANPAAMMKAHGAGGAQPGAAGAAGGYAAGAGANPAGFGPGIAGAGSGGGGAQQFPAGSAEAALAKFCMAIADGNLTEAAEYVSPKAKGMLVQIRDGSLTDEKLDSLKSSLAPQDLQLRPNARSSGTGKAINLGNGKNELLSFTLVKEDDAYLLREFRITKAPTR